MQPAPYRTVAIALAGVLIGTLGSFLVIRTGNSTADEQALQAVNQRLDRLEAQLSADPPAFHPYFSRPPGQATGIHPAVGASVASDLSSQPATVSGPQASLAEARRGRDLDASFQSEKRLPEWAAPAEKKLADSAESDLLAQANLVPQSFQTTCKSSRCRIRAGFPSASAADEWANLYIVGVAGTLSQAQMVQRPLPGGGSEVTIYGSR